MRVGRVALFAVTCTACEIPSAPVAPLEAGVRPRVWEGRRAGQWPSQIVPAGERVRTTSQDPGGAPVADAQGLAEGQTVHVLDPGGWWHEARVVRVIDAAQVRVHYVGRPPARDADVEVRQLRVGGTITDAMNRPPLR
ncbi:MAG: hypothetical protein U0325_23160 [Polyangiales bacterium]